MELRTLAVKAEGDILSVFDIRSGIDITYDNRTEDYTSHVCGDYDNDDPWGLGLAISMMDMPRGKPRADGLVRVDSFDGTRHWYVTREVVIMALKAWREIDYLHCRWVLENV